MSRIVVTLSIVMVSAAATATFTACDVGSVIQNSTGTDGGNRMDTGGSGSGSGSSALCEQNATATAPDGHHNAGMSCIAANCHLTGQTGAGAPAYTYAGTLYTTAAGTTPMMGSTIFIKMGGTEKKVITAGNSTPAGAGNFWMTGAPAGIEPPTNAMTGNTKASDCSVAAMAVPMSGALVQGGGNCNNCHRNGGTTSPIHLP
ncbi:MAG TPA: hypothetical protein VL326_16180 [Kofleriaceae bacterium]|nr:hypothetical protein [Kofleriaceae bacterium]